MTSMIRLEAQKECTIGYIENTLMSQTVDNYKCVTTLRYTMYLASKDLYKLSIKILNLPGKLPFYSSQ